MVADKSKTSSASITIPLHMTEPTPERREEAQPFVKCSKWRSSKFSYAKSIARHQKEMLQHKSYHQHISMQNMPSPEVSMDLLLQNTEHIMAVTLKHSRSRKFCAIGNHTLLFSAFLATFFITIFFLIPIEKIQIFHSPQKIENFEVFHNDYG